MHQPVIRNIIRIQSLNPKKMFFKLPFCSIPNTTRQIKWACRIEFRFSAPINRWNPSEKRRLTTFQIEGQYRLDGFLKDLLFCVLSLNKMCLFKIN